MSEKRAASRQQKKAAVIYLGPAIPGTVQAGVIFRNGVTTQMEEALQEEPALKMLLVEIGRVCKAKKELKDCGSAVSVCYKKAEAYAKKKGAKG